MPEELESFDAMFDGRENLDDFNLDYDNDVDFNMDEGADNWEAEDFGDDYGFNDDYPEFDG